MGGRRSRCEKQMVMTRQRDNGTLFSSACFPHWLTSRTQGICLHQRCSGFSVTSDLITLSACTQLRPQVGNHAYKPWMSQDTYSYLLGIKQPIGLFRLPLKNTRGHKMKEIHRPLCKCFLFSRLIHEINEKVFCKGSLLSICKRQSCMIVSAQNPAKGTHNHMNHFWKPFNSIRPCAHRKAMSGSPVDQSEAWRKKSNSNKKRVLGEAQDMNWQQKVRHNLIWGQDVLVLVNEKKCHLMYFTL